MSDQARAFFEQLGDRGEDPRLGRVRGSLRFDLAERDGIDSWRVVLDRGTAEVEEVDHEGEDADCVVRIDAASFDRMVEGRLNPTVAMLQGAIHVDGAIDLLWYFQKLFPSAPADARPAG